MLSRVIGYRMVGIVYGEHIFTQMELAPNLTIPRA
jgi:hypothetical protein